MQLISIRKWPLERYADLVQRLLEHPRNACVLSYVVDDKICCVYNAPDEQSVREHAKRGGVPTYKVSRVRSIIDPTTGE